MRYALLLLSLLLLPIQRASAQDAPSCTSETKASTRETTITCDNQPAEVLKQPSPNIFHSVVALSRTADQAHALSLVTGSASSHFTKVDTATALIDGQPHAFEASYTNGRTKAGIAIEQVVVIVPREHTDAIRTADNVWIRLENAVFDLSPTIAQMQRIHEMRTEVSSSP